MGLSRSGLFEAVGLFEPDVDQAIEQSYVSLEAARLVERRSWPRTAFVMSKFPGGDEKACGRHALYSLANPPMVTGTSSSGIAIMEAGTDVENQIVYRLGRAGRTIAGSVPLVERGPIVQLKLEEERFWLSGRADAVLDLRPEWMSVLPVDVKSKAPDKIRAMKAGDLSYDPSHKAQVMIYTHLCRKHHFDMGWHDLGLEPAAGGVILYVSRENPRVSHSFYFTYDRAYVMKGLSRLEEWRERYLAGQLPDRPKEWRWTEPPCKWCEYKKQCKEDIRHDVTDLEKSSVVRIARHVDPDYDFAKIKRRVVKRWSKKEVVK